MAGAGSRSNLRWAIVSSLLQSQRCNYGGKRAVQIPLRLCSSQVSSHHRRWQLIGAVCVERKPVITQPLTPMETKYAAFIDKLELEQSLKSDHELRHEGDIVRAEQLKAGTIDEADLDVAIAQTAQDFEDASQEELNQFKPASRVTEADLKDDRHSLERALDKYVMLVVKQSLNQSSPWIFPQTPHQSGETLRQTAERVLQELCGESLKVRFLGNAPVGFYKYKFPKQMRGEGKPVGAKVFFYKAQYVAGSVTPKAGAILDYHWMTYSNMEETLKQTYLHAVSQFLVNDEVPNNSSLKSDVQNRTHEISKKLASRN